LQVGSGGKTRCNKCNAGSQIKKKSGLSLESTTVKYEILDGVQLDGLPDGGSLLGFVVPSDDCRSGLEMESSST
jgi:hypothetical protein